MSYLFQYLLLFSTAVMGGALNSVAGGGSFITFPALLFVGVQPINANATNNAAMWLGGFASAGAYRRELMGQRRQLLLLSGVSLIGGIVGSLLLLHTSQKSFAKLIPYLLLVATLLFTFTGYITKFLQTYLQKLSNTSPVRTIGIILLQFVIAIYGGFFGGGAGILMLAVLSVMEIGNIHTMNAFKTFLTTCINGIALIPFIIAGVIVWPQALLMSVGTIAGGYLGARYARKVSPALIRRFVIVVGFSMTIYFFLHN